MVDTVSPTSPQPPLRFQVKWDGVLMEFQEVSGLESETQTIEYRQGNSATFSTIKMPGVQKIGRITLKKGVFKSSGRFWDWFNQIQMNKIKRVTVAISLLDEAGQPTMVWTLNNAWPTKVTGTDLKASGSPVAIESIELTHEGLTIANA